MNVSYFKSCTTYLEMAVLVSKNWILILTGQELNFSGYFINNPHNAGTYSLKYYANVATVASPHGLISAFLFFIVTYLFQQVSP